MSREGTRGYGRIARVCDGVENNVAGQDKDTGIRGQGKWRELSNGYTNSSLFSAAELALVVAGEKAIYFPFLLLRQIYILPL